MDTSRTGRIGQIKIYTAKCFRTFVHEKGWKSFISTFIIALILSWVIGDNTFEIFESTTAGVFALICGCIWTGLFNSIRSICAERAIIKREHRTGLHISSYIVAHMIFEFALCAVEGLILTIVFDAFRDFPRTGIVFTWTGFEFYISFTLVIFASDVLGLMLSCIVRTENAAMTVMPFVLIIQLVLSGMMFTLPEDAEFLKEATISKWGLSAICSSADINEIPSADTMEKFQEALDSDAEIHSWKDLGLTQEYDMQYDGTIEHVIQCWLVLLAFCGIYALIGIVFLKQVDRDKR